MNPKTLFTKFVNRPTIYSLSTINTYHFFNSAELTLDIVEKHLKNDVSLHIHCLSDTSLCKWGCVDIDIDNFKNLTLPLQNKIKSLYKSKALFIAKLFPEYETIVEDTGNRGYHVWVFFTEPKHAGLVRLIIGARLRKKKIYDVEIFPKQDGLSKSAPYGSSVRMPLGIHPKSNKRSVFIK